ncbi:MAG: ABC transporter permease [Actinomycetota bacterium]|nr:ABC transporter permease [Actinomycetota bacterium]
MSTMYRLLLGNLATRARLLGLAALGAVGVVLGLIIGQSDAVEPVYDGTRLIDLFGLQLFAPVVALVFASAVLGDPHTEGSLIYLWLRPVRRSTIALAGYAAALTVIVPLVVVPLTLAAVLVGGGGELVQGTIAASLIAVIAYTAIFLALGLRAERALAWGLGYLLIWEGFVANAGRGASRYAIRAYTQSLLTDATSIDLRLSGLSPTTSIVVPVIVAIVALVYVNRRLQTMDVA